MADLTPQERLQPSLLDRLAKDGPDRLSMAKLRQSVLRDLQWLFNAAGLSVRQEAVQCAQINSSVLNYGLPPSLAGNTAHSVDLIKMERVLRDIIWSFEPRILRNTVRVKADLAEERMSHNTLTFIIEGELWAQPTPIALCIKTEIDLEGGGVKVEEHWASVER